MAALPLHALEDAPPPDVAGILQALETLKDQHAKQETTLRGRAIQEVQAAVSSPARAVELWEQAEKVSKDAAQFKAWRDGEGSAMDSKEVQAALRIHFNWLYLTLQRGNGAKVRDLLPAVIAHTKEVTADQAAMENFDEQLKREKELADKSGRQSSREREKKNDEAIKNLRNKIVGQSVKGSPVAQMLKLAEFIDDAGPTPKQAREQKTSLEGGRGWEVNPFNVDGIFQTIVVPELEAQKDPRVLEYWDNKMRLAADKAAKTKSPLEVDRFNQVTRPQILWSRAQQMERIGMRNKAISEMFAVVKTYPSHPNIETWIDELKNRLAPQPASAGTAPAGPAETARNQ